jgi:hypothetical protein
MLIEGFMRERIALICGVMASLAFARAEGVRFLRWIEVQQLVTEVTDSKQWDSWIRQRDYEIRSSIDRCLEDSVSMLILFGTSFTTLPPVTSPTGAVTAAGDLTRPARARMDAFIAGLDQIDDERFRSVLQFLRRKQIAQDELRAYFGGNLKRAALERARIPHTHSTSIGATAVEQTLRVLISTGKAPARIRRIGVIGPGLDPEYDPDTDNQFASLDAALSSGLAKSGSAELVVLDINPWVLSHVRAVASKVGGRLGARIRAEDLNIVTQTIESAPGQGFDLVVASAGLAGYSRVEETLMMENVAQMLATGGVFIANGAASVTIPQEFEAVSVTEGITAYRRR